MPNPRNLTKFKMLNAVFVGCVMTMFATTSIYAQQNGSAVIVQPGKPGESTKILPSSTSAKLPPITKMDVEFMQGMIHHHQQAVEMVALMKQRTKNSDLLRLGVRISQTQAEEIGFMKRWLRTRGRDTSMQMPMMDKKKSSDEKMPNMEMPDYKDHKNDKMEMSDHQDPMMMPGMLTPNQMIELAKANNNEFDRLFLTGMIQHHEGALIMVDDLFKSKGAGQDAEIFTFATDVDSTQRTEIRIMQTMLGK